MEQLSPREKLKEIKRLCQQVSEVLTEFYGLEDFPEVRQFIWDESKSELEELFKTHIDKESRSATLSTVVEKQLICIIYLADEVMESLANSNHDTRLKGEHISYYADLIEEVSHFLYDQAHFQKYKKKPSHASAELQAVIDRYLVVQRLSLRHYKRTLGTAAEDRVLAENEAVHRINNFSSSGRNPEYIIGHTLGEQFVFYLNSLNQRGLDAKDFVIEFYQATEKERFELLLDQLELPIRFINKKEELAVKEYLQNLGIKLQEKNIVRQALPD